MVHQILVRTGTSTGEGPKVFPNGQELDTAKVTHKFAI